MDHSLVPNLLSLPKRKHLKLDVVVGQCRRERSVPTRLFGQGPFLKAFHTGKGKLLGMDDVIRLLTKKAILEANRPCKCLQCVRHSTLPAAELGKEVAPGWVKQFEKVYFLNRDRFWQNSVEKVVNCVSRPEGTGTYGWQET